VVRPWENAAETMQRVSGESAVAGTDERMCDATLM
jgi:hypothetical protein